MTHKRIDANHNEIVRGLRALSYSVFSTAPLGCGFPDIVVGAMTLSGTRINVLLEIKDGAKCPSKQKLTGAEQWFHENWQGQVHIVNCLDDAIWLMDTLRRDR